MRIAPTAGLSTIPPWREHTSREWNCRDVIARCPPEVLHHFSVGGFAERDDSRYVAGIVSDQYNVARLDGDIRPRSDRDTDIRRQECRSIVHSVADHRDTLSGPLHLLDLRRLLIRKHFGEHRFDPELLCDRISDRLCIPGHHDDFDPLLVQASHSFVRLFTNCIRDRQHSQRCPTFDESDRRLCAAGRTVERITKLRWRSNAELTKQSRTADHQRASFDDRFNTLTGYRLELFRPRQRKAAFLGALHDTLCDCVLGFLFNGSGEFQRIIRRQSGRRGNLHHAEFSAGERSRLVKEYRVEIPRFFQSAAVANQESGSSAKRSRDRDDERNCQAQRMRARNHEHSDDTFDRKCR